MTASLLQITKAFFLLLQIKIAIDRTIGGFLQRQVESDFCRCKPPESPLAKDL